MSEKKKKKEKRSAFTNVGWLFGFYGISIFVGYLTPNPFLSLRFFGLLSSSLLLFAQHFG